MKQKMAITLFPLELKKQFEKEMNVGPKNYVCFPFSKYVQWLEKKLDDIYSGKLKKPGSERTNNG